MSNTQTTKVQLTIEVEVYDVIHTFVERFRTMSGRTLIVFVLGENFISDRHVDGNRSIVLCFVFQM